MTSSAIRHRLDDLGLIDPEGYRIGPDDNAAEETPSPNTDGADSSGGNMPEHWSPRPNAHRGDSWTAGEDAALADEWHEGIPVKFIAAYHRRTDRAITSRLHRLGLID